MSRSTADEICTACRCTYANAPYGLERCVCLQRQHRFHNGCSLDDISSTLRHFIFVSRFQAEKFFATAQEISRLTCSLPHGIQLLKARGRKQEGLTFSGTPVMKLVSLLQHAHRSSCRRVCACAALRGTGFIECEAESDRLFSIIGFL